MSTVIEKDMVLEGPLWPEPVRVLSVDHFGTMLQVDAVGTRSRQFYPGIIVTAAAARIPEPLLDQLDEGGRMVVPVGPRGRVQVLTKILKEGGHTREIDLGAVAFVPFVSTSLAA